MHFKILTLLVFLMTAGFTQIYAQFPPAAGQEETTAIHNDSSAFIAWATACEILRGPISIDDPEGALASFGSFENALGFAEGNSVQVVSLGDGGSAILTFDDAIADGKGWDFAVFENALNDNFLELATVAVSSDGENYFSFPSTSLTSDTSQIDAFGTIKCEKIDNLAGKYRQGYGTPFDLNVLEGTSGLDVQHITHIKITDVVGCIQQQYCTYDAQGHIINDPWPTPFESCGFDLDGVGVIHSANAGIADIETSFRVYPNPFSQNIFLDFPEGACIQKILLYDASGILVLEVQKMNPTMLELGNVAEGFYFLKIICDDEIISHKVLKCQ